jgi:ankyrin repeat protein
LVDEKDALERDDVQRLGALLGAWPTLEGRGMETSALLMLASGLGSAECAGLLIQKGAGLEARDAYGKTPLRFAVMAGRIECAKRLVAAGADLDTQDAIGSGLLEAASSKGDHAMLEYLLDSGCVQGRSKALSSASCFGFSRGVELLLDRGAEIDKRGYEEKTPLMAAAESGSFACVEVLLERGAQARLLDDEGRSAEAIAWEAGSPECAELIRACALREEISESAKNPGAGARSLRV